MHVKGLVGFMVVALLIFSLSVPVFAQSKKEYQEQLSQARKNFIAERDKLHDQDRILRVNWHNERADLYKQLKANPGDKALQEKINEGAKKFLRDKNDVWLGLKTLWRDWLNNQAELGEKIKSAS